MQPKAVQVAGRSMRPVHHGATAEQDEPSPKVRRETLARGIQRGGARARRKRAENAILIGLPGLGTLLAIPYAFTVGVSTLDLVVLLCGYLFVGLGVSLGLHRHFSHRSFRAHWALRTALAIGGSMAFQGSILRWVSDHRRHHAFTDIYGDPHSPHINGTGEHLQGARGFWHAHIGWMFDDTVTDIDFFAKDLKRDRLVVFFSRTYWIWACLSVVVPALVGAAAAGLQGALGCFLIGGCLRTTILHNVVWAVNSFGHSVGAAPYSQQNQSRNILLLALLTFGDGWHNNHHRFPRSAFQGLNPGQLDINAWLLRGFHRLGLASDLKRPADYQLGR